MKLQKHLNKKGKKKDYYKWELVIPSEAVEKAGFQEGEELITESKKGKITLKKK